MGPTSGGSGGGMGGGSIPGMGEGSKKKKERQPVKDFQPKEVPADKAGYFSKQATDERKSNYKPPVLKPREPISTFQPANPSSFHKGGKVKKSGAAKVEKGEEVLTAKEAREYHKLMKKRYSVAGIKSGNRLRKSANRKRSSAKKRISKR